MQKYLLYSVFLILFFVEQSVVACEFYPMPFPDTQSWWVSQSWYQTTTHSNEAAWDFNYGTGEDDKGMVVLAVCDGTVRYANWTESAYGRVLQIDCGDVWVRYAHLDGFVAGIDAGANIFAGQEVAFVGGSGCSSGACSDSYWPSHLHFNFQQPGSSPATVNSVERHLQYRNREGEIQVGVAMGCNCVTNQGWNEYGSMNRGVECEALEKFSAASKLLEGRGLISSLQEYAHWYGSDRSLYVIEDWNDGRWGEVAITYDPETNSSDRAYVLRHGFWEFYRNSPHAPEYFGAPLGDEMDQTKWAEYPEAYDPYCDYDSNGRIHAGERDSCIERFCHGSTDTYSSMQRFEHVIMCWNKKTWSVEVIDPRVACYPEYGARTTAASDPCTSDNPPDDGGENPTNPPGGGDPDPTPKPPVPVAEPESCGDWSTTSATKMRLRGNTTSWWPPGVEWMETRDCVKTSSQVGISAGDGLSARDCELIANQVTHAVEQDKILWWEFNDGTSKTFTVEIVSTIYNSGTNQCIVYVDPWKAVDANPSCDNWSTSSEPLMRISGKDTAWWPNGVTWADVNDCVSTAQSVGATAGPINSASECTTFASALEDAVEHGSLAWKTTTGHTYKTLRIGNSAVLSGSAGDYCRVYVTPEWSDQEEDSPQYDKSCDDWSDKSIPQIHVQNAESYTGYSSYGFDFNDCVGRDEWVGVSLWKDSGAVSQSTCNAFASDVEATIENTGNSIRWVSNDRDDEYHLSLIRTTPEVLGSGRCFFYISPDWDALAQEQMCADFGSSSESKMQIQGAYSRLLLEGPVDGVDIDDCTRTDELVGASYWIKESSAPDAAIKPVSQSECNAFRDRVASNLNSGNIWWQTNTGFRYKTLDVHSGPTVGSDGICRMMISPYWLAENENATCQNFSTTSTTMFQLQDTGQHANPDGWWLSWVDWASTGECRKQGEWLGASAGGYANANKDPITVNMSMCNDFANDLKRAVETEGYKFWQYNTGEQKSTLRIQRVEVINNNTACLVYVTP